MVDPAGAYAAPSGLHYRCSLQPTRSLAADLLPSGYAAALGLAARSTGRRAEPIQDVHNIGSAALWLGVYLTAPQRAHVQLRWPLPPLQTHGTQPTNIVWG